jgi:hypothetical protein
MIEGGDRGSYNSFPKVEFEHFYGVSPRRYREIFERGKRKGDDGKFVSYGDPDKATGAAPILDVKFPFYAQLEDHLTGNVEKAIKDAIKIGEPRKPKRTVTAKKRRATKRRL